MAKKPSEKYHRMMPMQELNLTSLIDIITTLMFFMLIFISTSPLLIVDAPLPKIATTAEEIRKAKEMKDRFDVTIWITQSGFIIKGGEIISTKISRLSNAEYPFKELHQQLVKIHLIKPDVKEITLIPEDSIVYDVMIQTMDAARSLEKEDPGFVRVPPEIIGTVEETKFNNLFPEVTIGGV